MLWLTRDDVLLNDSMTRSFWMTVYDDSTVRFWWFCFWLNCFWRNTLGKIWTVIASRCPSCDLVCLGTVISMPDTATNLRGWKDNPRQAGRLEMLWVLSGFWSFATPAGHELKIVSVAQKLGFCMLLLGKIMRNPGPSTYQMTWNYWTVQQHSARINMN